MNFEAILQIGSIQNKSPFVKLNVQGGWYNMYSTGKLKALYEWNIKLNS